MKEESTVEKTEKAAIGALAAASKTPFKTAFMATLGIFAAQIVAGIVGLAVFVSVISLAYYLLK